MAPSSNSGRRCAPQRHVLLGRVADEVDLAFERLDVAGHAVLEVFVGRPLALPAELGDLIGHDLCFDDSMGEKHRRDHAP